MDESITRSRAGLRAAGVSALGATVADPLIGLAITIAILRTTWESWVTVREEIREEVA